MINPEDLKLVVKQKYSDIATQSKQQNSSSCCGATGCCSDADYTVFSDDYSNETGYLKDADLGLGCGLPTSFADIKPGDHVLDLGSGAGNDCFVARALTGDAGKVTGLDMTEVMVDLARQNNTKMGFSNIEFVLGDIESMPFVTEEFNVVISNCVLNLVPDKAKAFGEIYRVLKSGGHFCISDVVISGNLPDKLKHDAEMYAGCVSGAMPMEQYLQVIHQQGFRDIKVQKEKEIKLPDSLLLQYLSPDELSLYRIDRTGIFSITVTAFK